MCFVFPASHRDAPKREVGLAGLLRMPAGGCEAPVGAGVQGPGLGLSLPAGGDASAAHGSAESITP